MKLYVIRHGETIINVRNLVNGHNEFGLTEKGVEQAKKASKKIKKLNIDLIYCSPLKRTKETCEYVNKNNIEVIYDNRLAERDANSLDFLPVEEIDFDLWYDKEKETLYKDTEGFKSVILRIQVFLEEIKEKHSDKNILLVTHGDVCRAIYAYLNPEKTTQEITAYQKNNCEILEFEI